MHTGAARGASLGAALPAARRPACCSPGKFASTLDLRKRRHASPSATRRDPPARAEQAGARWASDAEARFTPRAVLRTTTMVEDAPLHRRRDRRAARAWEDHAGDAQRDKRSAKPRDEAPMLGGIDPADPRAPRNSPRGCAGRQAGAGRVQGRRAVRRRFRDRRPARPRFRVPDDRALPDGQRLRRWSTRRNDGTVRDRCARRSRPARAASPLRAMMADGRRCGGKATAARSMPDARRHASRS